MKRVFYIYLLLFIAISTTASNKPIRVVCIGNSITAGYGLRNRFFDSYPHILGEMLGKKYEVRNYGYSGRTMIVRGDAPYMKEKMYQEAIAYDPDIVTIKLGTNDSKPQNWKYKEDFKADLIKMIETFKASPSRPKIYLCLPVPALSHRWKISNKIISDSIIPIIKEVAEEYNLKTIDVYSALNGHRDFYTNDLIHPNELGAQMIANEVYKVIAHKRKAPQRVRGALPGLKSKIDGYINYKFDYYGNDVTIICPLKPSPGNPWAWFKEDNKSKNKSALNDGYYVIIYNDKRDSIPREQKFKDMIQSFVFMTTPFQKPMIINKGY